MNSTTKICCAAMAVFFTLLIPSCTKPDRAVAEEWCTSGQSILTIDDSYITGTVRNKIYHPTSSSGIISTTDARYNPTGRCVIIPFTFTDVPWNTAVDSNVIRNGYFGTGVGSFNDYFYENSWGQFGLSEVEIAKNVVNLPNPISAWGTTLSGPALVQAIVEGADVNWARADVNGDHHITQNEVQVILVYAFGGSGQTVPDVSFSFLSNLWNGYSITNNFVIADCKRNDATDKAINPIAFNSNIAHELGHGLFGLPDRYFTACATGTTGPYDIMADNCSWKHFTIYDKMKIGWITPKILEKQASRPDNARKCYSFPASETTPAALVLWTASAPDEFYIIENRYTPAASNGFESGFRQSGLAVWWARTTDDAIHLVSFKNWGQIPSTYNYNNVADHDSAIFINNPSYTSLVPIILRSSNNTAYFDFRAISPAGAMMFAEL